MMTTKHDENLITIEYIFKFKDESLKKVSVNLDRFHLNIISQKQKNLPEWTKLTNNKCKHCPLNPAQHPYCPVAENLSEVVEMFRNHLSYEEVEVTVNAENRTYKKNTDLAHGLGGLMGIFMVSSHCPHMEKLKPLVRFHLPFSSTKETLFRTLSMYLLAQYFRNLDGKKPDWELKDLVLAYEDVRQVNFDFSKRLLNAGIKDASSNALVNLDCFADSALFRLDKNKLDELELLFRSYLEK